MYNYCQLRKLLSFTELAAKYNINMLEGNKLFIKHVNQVRFDVFL